MKHIAESTNTRMLQLVAEKLGPLKDEVVFLGGVVMPFLMTEPNVPITRFTKDVDIIFEPETREELYEFEDALRDLGFKKTVNAAVCQWVIDHVRIDILPTDPDVIGFDNRWCAEAEQSAIRVNIGKGLIINVVPGHCFLGLKLCAFLRRGKGNYLQSYDIDDLILVIGGRDKIEKEVLEQASPELRKFIIAELVNINKAVNGSPGRTWKACKGDQPPRQLAVSALSRIKNIIGETSPEAN
ncbi:MAG: hypothetical protein KKC76_06160 [Proteobacteria bacterium]|nr:hypothetical protein [Pseudomonadota bacterium]MBU4297604.1 hypothetical protein [Pseudomonadota bacterium]MCG2750033.1 hypothetical protein [Desulfobulbaceae bacterium]